MRTFEVYKHPNKGMEVCPTGFSPAAFFFTWLWALVHRMWGVAAILLLFDLFVTGLRVFTRLSGVEALGLQLAIILPLRIYIARRACFWKAKVLEKRGYLFAGYVHASNRWNALRLVRKPDFKPLASPHRAQFSLQPRALRPVFAVASLTWKAAFRFKLFWVLTVLLLASVVVLPLLIKDDGTARGFTQILLTYTLSVITGLLGLATLWLACGILAKDIEECQLQMVAVKPIPRWQIWLGKWLGLVLLNLALLAVAGTSVYVLLNWRANRLPVAQREILRKEILVARGSLKPPMPDIDGHVQRILQQRLQNASVSPSEEAAVRKELRDRVEAAAQIAMPNMAKDWTIDVGARRVFLRDEPLFVRIKFYVARTNESGSYFTTWQIGPPDRMVTRDLLLAAETPFEFAIPPNLFDEQGRLFVRLINREPTTLVIPFEDGFEVLYREGGFALNFVRGLLIIACWLALLAAIGLASATFLSFPVAAFVSASLLFVVFSSGTLSTAVAEGSIFGLDHETGQGAGSLVDVVLLPLFQGILWLINVVQGFSPVESLSTGRSIGWWELARACVQIVILMGGIAAATGMAILTRRELATAQPQI